MRILNIGTHELYQDAVTNGKAPGNMCKIQFLGDARAGKTSLCKKLRGVQFDPNEKPTHGIGTKLCKVNNVDDVTWKDIPGDTNSTTEFEETTTWFLANQLLSKENLIENNLQPTYKTMFFEVMISFLLIALSLCAIVALFGHVRSFCILTSVAALLGIITRNTDLERVISGLATVLLFWRIEMNLIWETGTVGSEVISPSLAMQFIVPCLVLGFSSGFICGCGLRRTTTFAIVCLWIPAESFSVTQTSVDRHSFLYVAVFQTGTILGFFFQNQFPNFGYQIFSKLTGCGLHTNLHQYISFIMLVIILLCWLSIWTMQKLVLILVLTFLCGMASAFGLIQGRKKYNNFVKIHMCWRLFKVDMGWRVFGICTGWLLAYSSGFVLAIKHLSLSTILGIVFRFGLLHQAVVVEHHIVSSNVAPITTVSDKIFQAVSKEMNALNLKKKLSLWDFAGQELYYNTHHAFMATHAIYLLVFDLTRFLDSSKRFLQYQRIHFWLQSIYTHTLAPVILVGTHADQVTQEIIEVTNKVLAPNLTRLTIFSQNQIVSNGKLAFFVVDNSHSILDDTSKLRTVLQNTANQMEPMKAEYPIKWRQFLTFIHDIRQKVEKKLAPQSSLILTVKELQQKLKNYDAKELKQVLCFFNDAGEIIYDDVDCVLRQFVLFDPQFIVDFMYNLTPVTEPDDHLSAYRTILHTQGILHDVLVRQFLNTMDNDFVRSLLTILEGKDLIYRIPNTKHYHGNPTLYIVPSLLPAKCSNPASRQEWTKRFYIDFAQFFPHAVLSRLMSRCATYSDISHESSSMCRDGGIFSLGNQFCFRLLLLIPCPTQHLIEVAIRAVPGANPVDLLRHIWRILETIRYRDFQRLRYRCGILCPHPPPHQGCPDGNVEHVIPLASHEEPFTEEEQVFRLCFTRLIEMDLSLKVRTM